MITIIIHTQDMTSHHYYYQHSVITIIINTQDMTSHHYYHQHSGHGKSSLLSSTLRAWQVITIIINTQGITSHHSPAMVDILWSLYMIRPSGRCLVRYWSWIASIRLSSVIGLSLTGLINPTNTSCPSTDFRWPTTFMCSYWTLSVFPPGFSRSRR